MKVFSFFSLGVYVFKASLMFLMFIITSIIIEKAYICALSLTLSTVHQYIGLLTIMVFTIYLSIITFINMIDS